ncbi:MAG: hypothetical protein OXT49_00410 [Gammaproteobacteria bacterium]|nr:hypothetical protein [Gammaproteobacteria bacterium]
MKNQFVVSAAAALAFVLLSSPAMAQDRGTISKNEFNPALSLILDGGLSVYSNDEDYEIAGFPLGGEAGPADEGFALNEIELVGSADIDDKFYGKITLGIHQDEGETEVDIEEAFFQTTALPHGFTVKGGTFFSELGYLNVHHKHAWDFADAPLVYRALLGRQYGDTGLQARWIAPTETFLEFGAEWTRGDAFPAGGSGKDGRGAGVLFAHVGGDFNESSSWQLGLSHLQANEVSTELGGHAHGAAEEADNEFEGETTVSGIDFVYKWAPNGNSKQRNLKIQAEYFVRNLEGEVSHVSATENESGTIDAEQTGWYAQMVYQFRPQWRVGVRYDELSSDITGSNADALEETGFADEGVELNRSTIMVDYSNSEFSRLRLQYSTEDSRHPGEEKDEQIFVQYVYSLGSHGAHRF